ncbi:glycosyltransferase family 4 protein [Phytohabitans sp. ZYX-F-186]|uniref:Glycosyltransferase family 4 protein n=1 Tax=Phytohabitans maris TaxID=3071409 RepID=A0ABU0ZMF2_9ACTN|nr:glycosyltransferase family 4 protein [Phytohabitans sp. ZYX-F-186]MDQ7908217.1 glycosyltransferase family 4 protein [Phytohabitans sp. ZYX-F-186]
MRVGIVSQFYAPEPAFIPASLAGELARRGHEVRVLTGYPNYPSGRVYPGYRQRWRDVTESGGVRLRRVPLYPSHDTSTLRRAANYLSFAVSSTAAGVRYLSDVDVVYVYHPPATSFTAAWLLRVLHRVPAVLHVQDVWPDSVTASAMSPAGRAGRAVHTALGAVMRRIYAAASSIAVIAPSMRELVVERGADPGKVEVVLNWTDETLFRPVRATAQARAAIGHRGRRVVMHAGNIGPFQHIEGAVRAAAAVAGSTPLDLVVVGSGTEDRAVRSLAGQLGADNVRFLGRRDPAEMAALYAAADYQLVSLKDLPIFRGTIPSKLPAALACGSPVVVAAPGDCARMVEGTGVGLSCPPENWPELAAGFRRAAALPEGQRSDMARRARDSYQRHMSLKAGVDALEIMLDAARTGRGTR